MHRCLPFSSLRLSLRLLLFRLSLLPSPAHPPSVLFFHPRNRRTSVGIAEAASTRELIRLVRRRIPRVLAIGDFLPVIFAAWKNTATDIEHGGLSSCIQISHTVVRISSSFLDFSPRWENFLLAPLSLYRALMLPRNTYISSNIMNELEDWIQRCWSSADWNNPASLCPAGSNDSTLPK